MKSIGNFAVFPKETEHVINGVKYIVSSSFPNANIANLENTIRDRIKNYVGSEFAELDTSEINDIIDSGNVNRLPERRTNAVKK